MGHLGRICVSRKNGGAFKGFRGFGVSRAAYIDM